MYQVLNLDYVKVIVMFVVFIFFLLLQWAIFIRVIINYFAKTMTRARISVKLIPALILIGIKESEKEQDPKVLTEKCVYLPVCKGRS